MSKSIDKNVKELIEYYLSSEDKKLAISDLADKYYLTERRIYQILKENEIPTPREFKSKNDNKNDIKKKAEPDFELLDDESKCAVTIMKKVDYLWGDKLGKKEDAKSKLSTLANILAYFEETTGLDSFEVFMRFMENAIMLIEKDQLETNISNVKAGNVSIKNILEGKQETDQITERIEQLGTNIIERFLGDFYPEEDSLEEQRIKATPFPIDIQTFLIMIMNPSISPDIKRQMLSMNIASVMGDMIKNTDFSNTKPEPTNPLDIETMEKEKRIKQGHKIIKDALGGGGVA